MRDIGEEIDRSFGEGPAHGPTPGPVEDLVGAGRRVVRGRRVALAAGVAVVAVALAGSAVAVNGGGEDPRRSEPPVASEAPSAAPTTTTTPTPSPTPSPTGTSGAVVGTGLRGPDLAGYDQSGRLVVYRGSTVLRRAALVDGGTTPGTSAALEIAFEGRTSWWYVTLAADGSQNTSVDDADASGDFAAWVADQTSAIDGRVRVLDGPGDIAVDRDHALSDPDLIGFTADGRLELYPGATLLRRVENPFDLRPPRYSVAAAITWRGEESWIVLDASGGGGSSSYSGPGEGRTFEQFVAETVAAGPSSTVTDTDDGGSGTGDSPPAAGRPDDTLVRLGAGGSLSALDGVTILEQRSVPDLAADLGDTTVSVAEVERGGERVYVLARRASGIPVQYVAVTRAVGGASLDAFVAFARTAYAGGEGLL